VPAVVTDAAGPDAADRWAQLSLPQKREIISTLMEVRILPTTPGTRMFNPDHIEIEWKVA
jgi:site-specific DNA recombinase